MINMQASLFVVIAVFVATCTSQRSPYAGSRPIGYPSLQIQTTTATAQTAQNNSLGNRFGDGQNTTITTTQRLPIEALGDADLVNRLSKLPTDKQPFWLINSGALETNRNKPLSYPQSSNTFIDETSNVKQPVPVLNTVALLLNRYGQDNQNTSSQQVQGSREPDNRRPQANTNFDIEKDQNARINRFSTENQIFGPGFFF